MQRSKRRTLSRLLGWGVAIGLYVSSLVLTANLFSGGEAPRETDSPPVTGTQQAESPLMTIALAAAAVGGLGAWRLVRLARRPRPAPIRQVRRRVITPT